MPLKTCEYNMLNIACVSPNGKPAAVEYNTKQIINGIMRFNRADIIVFPRLCISSASLRAYVQTACAY